MQTIAAGLGLRFTPEAADDGDHDGDAATARDDAPPPSSFQRKLESSETRAAIAAPHSDADNADTFAPIDLLDYIYAVLHSPAYRERYKEFLKIDFPRVPYPADKKQFRRLVALGGELRALHLMESPTLDNLITGYLKDGDHKVDKPNYEITDAKNRLGKVHINKTQYFSNVPETAWHFHIGGYQSAQKWLKDRKGRTLTADDIRHYQKIIIALTETERLMGVIDEVVTL